MRINPCSGSSLIVDPLPQLKNLQNGPVSYLGLELTIQAKSISWDSLFKWGASGTLNTIALFCDNQFTSWIDADIFLNV